MSQAVPVQKWVVEVEQIVDEDAALDAWRSLVRAQGWSPVGEPKVIRGDFPRIVGRLVKYPGLTVSADIRGAIAVPQT